MFDDFVESYEVFRQCGVERPLHETLRLFDVLTDGALRKTDLSLLTDKKIDLRQIAKKRKDGVPLEYIMERAVFMGMGFYCSPDTLIPRAETELLVRVAMDFIEKKQESKRELTIVDVGTGCGNVAVSLAVYSDDTQILASDISSAAVEVARSNVNRFKLQERISLFCGDALAPFEGSEYEGQIDLVVCNPPYIPTGSLEKLSPEIIDHEPKVALDAGSYGIDFFRKLIRDSVPFLKPGGILVFEIGEGQEKLVTRLFQKAEGYRDIGYFDDGKHVRVMSAVKEPGIKPSPAAARQDG
jgi:release factor glutamine methyltransferase